MNRGVKMQYVLLVQLDIQIPDEKRTYKRHQFYLHSTPNPSVSSPASRNPDMVQINPVEASMAPE